MHLLNSNKDGTGLCECGCACVFSHAQAVLREAVPEDRDGALAKRALALVAAASLGGYAALTSAAAAAAAGGESDPPFTLRSSPCGILLRELGLKPPKVRPRPGHWVGLSLGLEAVSNESLACKRKL